MPSSTSAPRTGRASSNSDRGAATWTHRIGRAQDVSAKQHADPSFVTTQSNSLEKQGFVRRTPSSEDARVVLMSLTDKARKSIASLGSSQESIRQSIFSELNDRGLRDVNETLSILSERFQKAAKRLAAEL